LPCSTVGVGVNTRCGDDIEFKFQKKKVGVQRISMVGTFHDPSRKKENGQVEELFDAVIGG
jgi:hypothetical protein